jgi:hypothetical protein
LTSSKSWFRPRLDDPGPWHPWELDGEELRRVEQVLQGAADEAIARLRSLFGQTGDIFGANGLARSLASVPRDVACAFSLAVALTAFDYHCYRATPPRPRAGGLTNRSNQQIWKQLRTHLFDRLLAILSTDATQSILWRSVLGRIPESWIPAALIEQALARHLSDLEPYTGISVELDLKPQVPGGQEWIQENTEQAVAAIEQSLARRRPSLVEVIRDPSTSPIAAQAVVVYGVEPGQEGGRRLLCYDPAQGSRTVSIFLETAGGRLYFAEHEPAADLPSIKALRVWSIEPAVPPLFGFRLYLDRLLPWRLFWFLKRGAALLVRVGDEDG